MAFTFQLKPEMERTLAEQARLKGISLESYVQSILERQLAFQSAERALSEEAFEAELEGLAAYSDKIPSLPLDAFRRDEIYRDHN